MERITLEDVYSLRKQFEDYTKTAEQHEFPLLFKLDMNMQHTISEFEKVGDVTDQAEARAMFFVVLCVIGGDYKPYEKKSESV